MPALEITAMYDYPLPTPVRMEVPARMIPAGDLRLREEGGRAVPAQRDGEAVVALVSGLAMGRKARFFLEKGPAAPGVTAREAEGAIAIALPEGPLTTYHFNPANPRPFFYPVLGPGGKMVTRSYPMKDVPGETKDHPHHRSFWTAYGEVNGIDDWSEAAGKHGWIKHRRTETLTSGPVFGGFAATGVWTAADGKPVLDEWRSLRVYNAGPDYRLLDYEVRLTASYEEVHYGDTKEGGILAFRVATSMDGSKGGRLENSVGGVMERQVWGKRAAWLDYSGPVEGEVLGITMMDHPGNLNHPCYWHARDYGLVGTNPFAKASFEPGLSREGHRQPKGETLRFRYRVLLHRGGAKEGHADPAYHGWIHPPVTRVVQVGG